MQPKEALIGGTINLGNYESFKFEFRGIVEKPENYLDLAAFAAGSLLSQGAKADDEVRGKIRSFVGKVFGLPDEKVPDVRVVPKVADPAPVAPKEEKRETKAWSGGDPRPLKMEGAPAMNPFDTGETDIEPPTEDLVPQAAAKPVSPANADEGGICEICGGKVTKTQKQMSMLFMNRVLCKGCMDKATGKEASKC